ncbi:MAG: SDR family NAD(P)-dependent oxidoreductase [Ferruginibacter sp.]
MNKTVFITGATSGIGQAVAQLFAANGYSLILNGRRLQRLEALAKTLREQYSNKIYTLCFDVRDRVAVFNAIDSLPVEWQQVDILINNAGLALGREPFDEANIDDWDTMLQTNVHGLLYVSKALMLLLKKSANAHIINIGSTAAKEVYENGNVYCASKSAVEAISKAMRIDLLKYGIKVTAIHPGAVETEFSLVRYKGDTQKASATYTGYIPLSATDVADAILYCVGLPPHVCINDLVITATSQANSFYIFKQ